MPAPDLDCLLVHAPKAHNHYLPLGDFFNITYLPMGLPALANALRSDGWRTEIVHLGVQWLVDPGRTVLDLYDGAHIRCIGLTLYWHYQTFDAVEAARALKQAHPEAFVVFGGITAGYFAEQLLEAFPFVDAVLVGHAEGSLRLLVATLAQDGDLGAVPDVVCRDAHGGIVSTRGRPYPTGARPALDDLVYGDLSALRDADVYARSFGFPLAWSREATAAENRARQSMGRPFFPLFTGRGCPWQCTFCGGNQATLRKVNGTAKVTWRRTDRVVDDIRLAMDHGYRTMSLCFDPVPWDDRYYLDLFSKIREARLEVDFYFECWGLPTPAFVEAFRRTFPSPESYVAVSPDAGHEGVRKANKQPYYSDAELFDALDLLATHRVSFDTFFTLALPGETLVEARATSTLKRRIADAYTNARRIMTWTVLLEPGSPQFERPQDFRMLTDRKTFLDFYQAHGGDRADTYSSLGFKIEGYFGDDRDEGGIPEFERHLQHLKCMEFCFLSKDPRDFNAPEAGRQHCLERRQELATRRGHAAPERPIGPGHDYVEALAAERLARGPRPRASWLARSAEEPR